MSAPEPQPLAGEAPGLQLDTSATDIIEIAALRGRARELERRALARGVRLPALGGALFETDHLALCVRPQRWLILTPPAARASAADWQSACAGVGAALELSSGLSAMELAGSAAREVLVRGCRLDLDPDVFPVGAATATIMAQVAVILVALPSAMLLLTPSSTARHFHQWLLSTAKPFGLMPPARLDDGVVPGHQPP